MTNMVDHPSPTLLAASPVPQSPTMSGALRIAKKRNTFLGIREKSLPRLTCGKVTNGMLELYCKYANVTVERPGLTISLKGASVAMFIKKKKKGEGENVGFLLAEPDSGSSFIVYCFPTDVYNWITSITIAGGIEVQPEDIEDAMNNAKGKNKHKGLSKTDHMMRNMSLEPMDSHEYAVVDPDSSEENAYVLVGPEEDIDQFRDDYQDLSGCDGNSSNPLDHPLIPPSPVANAPSSTEDIYSDVEGYGQNAETSPPAPVSPGHDNRLRKRPNAVPNEDSTPDSLQVRLQPQPPPNCPTAKENKNGFARILVQLPPSPKDPPPINNPTYYMGDPHLQVPKLPPKIRLWNSLSSGVALKPDREFEKKDGKYPHVEPGETLDKSREACKIFIEHGGNSNNPDDQPIIPPPPVTNAPESDEDVYSDVEGYGQHVQMAPPAPVSSGNISHLPEAPSFDRRKRVECPPEDEPRGDLSSFRKEPQAVTQPNASNINNLRSPRLEPVQEVNPPSGPGSHHDVLKASSKPSVPPKVGAQDRSPVAVPDAQQDGRKMSVGQEDAQKDIPKGQINGIVRKFDRRDSSDTGSVSGSDAQRVVPVVKTSANFQSIHAELQEKLKPLRGFLPIANPQAYLAYRPRPPTPPVRNTQDSFNPYSLRPSNRPVAPDFFKSRPLPLTPIRR